MVKGLLEGVLFDLCDVYGEEEVVFDVKVFDMVVEPDPSRLSELDGRGLFGRFAREAYPVCGFEAFHDPPSADDFDDGLLRVIALYQKRRAVWDAKPASTRGPAPVRARLCVVSAGSPDLARKQWGLVQRPEWPAGCLWAGSERGPHVIVASELPRTPETLMARMMGKGETLKRAYEDLRALPEGAWERRAAAAVLVTLRRELPRMGLGVYTPPEETMGYYKEGLKIMAEERREVALSMLLHQFERKLKRELTDEERATVLARLLAQGAEPLSDLVLDLDGAQLAAWLATSDAR